MGKQPAPKLSNILDSETRTPTVKSLLKPKVLTALVMLLCLWFAMWVVVHELQIYAAKNLILLLCYPFTGISTIVLSTPLILYISYSEDFKDINPLRPDHFFFLLKRVVKAVNENQSKITPKNL
eukprot:TRINITY_DN19113_c0_g1_i12.p2 TRINITY_DN19113_c0_g1~~TRINITY_DN19113_c0_g1_i12.p2  ORF type:complete len:136 (-),score=1.17 TRINITY_DN19113_c0_g1_i12:243-614(-)